jgi:hypothetical protein
MSMKPSCVLTAAAVLLLHGALAAQEKAPATAVGAKIAGSGSLRDVRGNRRTLQEFAKNKACVLIFLGTECPVSNLYAAEVARLEKLYRPKQVQFVGVYANEHEDLDHIAAHALDRDFPFPVVRDSSQKLADSLGVTRVPTAVVLDGDLVLRYRGRIDDQYGAASKRVKATRADLALALDDLLAGQKVAVAETEADGCLLDRGRKTTAKSEITYTKDIAPILQKRCQTCHRPEQIAPFSLLEYQDAVKHSAMIREVIRERRMPPWHADPRFGHFSNDRRMSRDEIDLVTAWIDGGMTRGNAKDLPKPLDRPTDWMHGKPDLVIQMPEEFEVPATGVVPYKNWIIPTNFTEDKWVRVAEARPGVAAVVHHVVIYILQEGQKGPVGRDGSLKILVGWAPGDLGLVLPADTALRVPKGASLRFEMHYTPNGTKVKDRSSVGLTFSAKPPRYEMLLSEFANMGFEIPAGDPHHKAEATFRLRADARLLGLAPHMHWRGKDYFYEAIYPDGKRETLLAVPRWDFNWQSAYRFAEPVKLPKGTRLHAVAHWDNSTFNPLNPDPSKSIRFGLQSWEEMMVGFAAYVWERPETAAELAKTPQSQADMAFDRLDVNGDDFLTPDEIPGRLRTMLQTIGLKMPERMSRAEFNRMFDTMQPLFQPKKK